MSYTAVFNCLILASQRLMCTLVDNKHIFYSVLLLNLGNVIHSNSGYKGEVGFKTLQCPYMALISEMACCDG